MGFLDTVKDALKGKGSAREPKSDSVTATPSPSDAVPPAPAQAPAQAPAPPQQRVEEQPPTEQYDTYTVKAGDTIGSICARVGISYQQITTINKIENPDLIFPGQVFQIPRKK